MFVVWNTFLEKKSFVYRDFQSLNSSFISDGKSVCEVPSVQADTQTSLSCFFPKDLNESKLGFTVYHYPSRGDAGIVNHRQYSLIPPLNSKNITFLLYFGDVVKQLLYLVFFKFLFDLFNYFISYTNFT